MRLVKEFIGKEVLSADVEILGKVSDIDWDVDSNQIESLIVSGSGIQNTLKISNGELVIPFDTVDKIGDKVVLKSAFAEDDGLSNIEKEIQDLKNQLYYESSSLPKVLPQVDYSSVDPILKAKREESLALLRASIEGKLQELNCIGTD